MAQSSDCQWQACSGGHTGPRRPARLRRSSGPAARPGAVPSEQSPTCAGVGFRVLGGSSVARITPVQDWVYEPGTVAGTGPGNRDSGNRCSCQFLLRPRAGSADDQGRGLGHCDAGSLPAASAPAAGLAMPGPMPASPGVAAISGCALRLRGHWQP